MPPRGLLVMELGSGSDADLMDALDRLLPRDDRWRHRHGSPGHRRATTSCRCWPRHPWWCRWSDGRMALGTWQSVALLDPSGDHATRTVRLSFLPG